ncbi:hypothetical protein B0T09DRAFT_348307 [Sordaria sp. MPI-SDFR-AT-0083]|nr:hypothetical protein B0T09DRAFT_348307 [Sordaria sp. MPI-SDFR-AT-0083]
MASRGLLCSDGICSCGIQGTSRLLHSVILSSVAWVAVHAVQCPLESSTGSESLTPLACPNSNNGNCYNKDGRVTISW